MPKILIIRFSSIGDIVLTTPVARCIKKQIPDAVVHYVTKKSFRGILENNPNIDHVYTIEKDIDEVSDQLKKEDYDFVVDLHHNLRSALLKRKLKKPGASFPKLNIKKFLLTQFKINRLPELHVVDRYFEAVKPLKVQSDILVGDFIIPPADEVDINNFDIPEKFVAFAIGAQMTTKKLPNEKIAALLDKIKLPVVLLGGETDFDNSEIIMKKIAARNEENKIINLCGRLNLNQSASVVRQSLKIITHDTGLMHIASCFRKQTISIWGNTTPDFGMYPYMPMNPALYSIHQVENLKCRPCSKIGYKECPKKHFNCMNLQNLDKIAKEVNG
ncbi:MAG: glycosyltransferase family 9 protein [Crocinitomicaceae bacterium]|nr:glycosyltransferase family 9 protein [Crocinitomicaceae bacterium]